MLVQLTRLQSLRGEQKIKSLICHQVITMSKRAHEVQINSVDTLKKPCLNSIEEQNALPHVPAFFPISRAKPLTIKHDPSLSGDCVILWMSRDQRVNDNYALYYAQSMAIARQVPLKVVFNLVPNFLQATLRQYGFMIKGLKEVESSLRNLNIPFHLLLGNPVENIVQFTHQNNAVMLVCDFTPLKVGSSWCRDVAHHLDNSFKRVPLIQVDAHNIVPCWVASPKLEYSARTFRGKITPKITEYLHDIPVPTSNPVGSLEGCNTIDWEAALDSLAIDRLVDEVDWIIPGAVAAQAMFHHFVENKLKDYGENRNDPNLNFSSNLSPYIHFGQISVQQMILELKRLKKQGSSVDSFIEEVVVRRELADNFCYCKCFRLFYTLIDHRSNVMLDNQHYDSLDGCNDWARETLQVHRHDPRPVTYSRDELEQAKTHDDLWNAAQIQVLREGKMHVGYSS
jgi:deoxyribodipyrimidine photo-lyase